ncbi:MAG: hypothetical protein KDD73_07720 [Anaerolineales bacterium]|nr:hypothetical protein [Anaerolineales bacterium]MCB9127027.1 hypothetical protein [Ardenticatenales bacterium]
MIDAITWYLALLLAALAALPLGWSWFRHLPDRGWGLMRALGLLLMGSLAWLGGIAGLWRLSAGSGVAAMLLIGGLGLWTLQRWGGGLSALGAWLRAERRTILAQELLFFVAFAFWLWFRLHDVEGIQNTERPMDFALLNAILRGGELPPNDPWLSGFSISYYYLGYLIIAQLIALVGVPSGIGYNLGMATLAALTIGGAFSLGYALLRDELQPRTALLAALVTPLWLALSSNLTGLLTLAYHHRLLPDSLFTFFNVHDLTPGLGSRGNISGWWWWPASRTVSDYGVDGGRIEIIDEFPFFSFMLGDMHPHVLALPFALLVIGIALNSYRAGLLSAPARWRRALLPAESWGRPSSGWLWFLLSALVAGAFVLLNTWDWPTVLTLLAGGWLLALWARAEGAGEEEDESRGLWWQPWGISAVALLLASVLLYLPFHLGFGSQADGIRLSRHFTYLPHYLLMFGLFWLVLLPFVLSQLGPIRRWVAAVGGNGWPALLLVVPALLGVVLQRWSMALIAAFLGLTLLALWAQRHDNGRDAAGTRRFTLALTALALGLTLVPEILYLQDHFGNRMNTIFKLYYQAWTLFALAATFAVVYLFRRLPTPIGLPWFLVVTLLSALTLWYPATTLTTKVNAAGPAHWDGRFWMAEGGSADQDRFAAIEWLNQLPNEVVIVERAGGAYNPRESALSGFTGHSTLLGWQNHESQWRGGNALFAERPAVIDEIYSTRDATRLRQLLADWQVDYVAVTDHERQQYGLTDDQLRTLDEVLNPVFQQGSVTLYGW